MNKNILGVLDKIMDSVLAILKKAWSVLGRPLVYIYRAFEKFILSIDFKNQPSHKKALLILGGFISGLITLWFVLKIGGLFLSTTCAYIAESNSNNGFARKFKAVNVEATEAKIDSITKRITTVGNLRPNHIVTFKAEMNGRIASINLREGSEVKKDDILIQFDDGDAKAELKEAEAQLILREADFKRSTELKRGNFESTKKLDEAKAQFVMAEAKLEAAKSRFNKTQVKATFDGTVGLLSKGIDVGGYAQAGQELVTLVDDNPMKVEFKIPEKNLHDAGVGQMVELKLDGFLDQKFTATVEAIDAKADTASHSMAIVASAPNPKGLLKGGLFCTISLITGEKGDAIVIPEAALEREGEIEFVWIIKKNKAMRKRVLTGSRENDQVEIIAGLEGGDMVITAGQLRVNEGTTVKIINLNEDGSKKSPEDLEKTKAVAVEENSDGEGDEDAAE